MTMVLVGTALLLALIGRQSAVAVPPALRVRLGLLVYATAVVVALPRTVADGPLYARIALVAAAAAASLLWRWPERLRTWTSDIGEPLVLIASSALAIAGVERGSASVGLVTGLVAGWAGLGLLTGVREQTRMRARGILIVAGLGPLLAVGLLWVDPWPAASGATTGRVALLMCSTMAVVAVALHAPPMPAELGARVAWALLGAGAAGAAAGASTGGSEPEPLLLSAVVGALLVDAARRPRRRASGEGPRASPTAREPELSDAARQTLVVIERMTDPLAAQTQVVKALDDMFPGGRFELLRNPQAPKGLLTSVRQIDQSLLSEACRASSLSRDALDDLPLPAARAFEALGGTMLLPVVCDATVYGALLVYHEHPSPEVLVHARRFADLLAYKLETHRLYSELEQKQRLATLGTFSAALAHDLRSPLAAVRLNLQLVEHTTSDRDHKDAIAEALRSLDRVFTNLNETLDFTRPLALEVGSVELGELVPRTVTEHQLDAREQGVSLVCRVEGEPPPIRGDSGRLARVFDNLVRNALEVAPDDSEVTVRVRAVDDGVEVSVRDRGPGVAADVRERIFEPFVTTKKRGVGLGLAITHKIVERHRGRVTVDTREGEGTTLTVWLPRPKVS